MDKYLWIVYMELYLGSCRIVNIKHYEYTHSTKDILQLFNFIDNIDSIEYYKELLLINREWINKTRFKNTIKNIREIIKNSKCVIIEISSLKSAAVTISNNIIYPQWDILNNIVNGKSYKKDHQRVIEKLKHCSDEIIKSIDRTVQSKEELINDLYEIYTYLRKYDVDVVFVPHINATFNGKRIANREIICNTIKEFSNDDAQSHCHFFDPMNYLVDDCNEIFEVDNGNVNSGHYSKKSRDIVRKELVEYVKNVKTYK